MTNATTAQLESWSADNEFVEEFLADAMAWTADPGRQDDGLRDPARRLIYWVMKNESFDMTAQTFGKWSGARVLFLLNLRIKFTLIYKQRRQHSWVTVKTAGYYASLAVRIAHPGFTTVSGGILPLFWSWFDEPLTNDQSIRDWFSAPFHLRIQDCEAALRRVADTNLSADAMPTVAPTFAAPQASATPPTAASPAPFSFTGGTLAAADVRAKATAPTTAFPFSAPVVGYKGLTTGDVQRSESAKPCCTRTCRLRKSRAQWLKGLPKAFRLRSIKACHLGRLRVLQGREQSQNRALLQSAKAGCSETHVRQNKSEFFSAPRFVREELRPGYADWTARLRASYAGQRAIYAADTVTGMHQTATESTASPSSTAMAVSRVRPTFIAFRTDDEDSEIAWDEYEAFLQILADFSPGGKCMVHLEGAAFLASTRTQLLKQELRASARRVIFHALHHVLGPAAWRASRNHVLMILIGCEWTPAYGLPAPRYDYGDMMHYDEAARIITVAMDEDSSVDLLTNKDDPYATLRWLPNYKVPVDCAGNWTGLNREKWCSRTKSGHSAALSFVCIHYAHLFTYQVRSPAYEGWQWQEGWRSTPTTRAATVDPLLQRTFHLRLPERYRNKPQDWGTGKLAALQDWPEWDSVCSHYYVLSSSDARDRCQPWQGSQEARDYVRARLAGIIQADSGTFGGQKYRRHGTGQGRTYRLRGSVTQGERVLFTGTNKDQARTKAGRQNDTALISIAAVIEPKVGGESAVSTAGGLDSSFAASNASTRRPGDREGGGQEEEGASNYTEDTAEEGGSYTEGEGTIEGMGSSIRGGGGESFLSEQEGRGRRLFRLLHRRRGPSRRSRSRLRRPQGAVRFSALHGRSGGVRVKGYQGGGGEGISGDRPREVIKRGCAGRRGQCHVCSPWVVLCMTRGCTDGTGPWPTLEP